MRLETLIAQELALHATPHGRDLRGQNGCTIPVSFMLTSGGRESFGGRLYSLLAKSERLIACGRPDSRLTVCPACAEFCMHEPAGPACHTAWQRFSGAECMHNRYSPISSLRKSCGVILYIVRSVRTLSEANGPISAAASVRPRPAQPAALTLKVCRVVALQARQMQESVPISRTEHSRCRITRKA